jgi:amidophosphoribosyltransferase
MLELLEEHNKYHLVQEVYDKCKAQVNLEDKDVRNFVKDLYAEFTANEISNKIAELISDENVNAQVETIFQSIENLHDACPKNLGDWYFTGNYPTVGGNRVVNKAFINFYEGNKERAY